MTKLIKDSDPSVFKEIANCVKNSGVFIYPTETLYGIGCLASNESACEKIVEIKGRSENKGLIVLVKDKKMLEDHFIINKEITNKYLKIDKPLTLILESKTEFPRVVSGGTNKIAVRISSNIFVQKLLNLLNEPITSTSANISGKENLFEFDDIYNNFNNKVDLIVNSGNIPPSKGSAILDLTKKPPTVIRKGDLTDSEIKEFLYA
ncbi:MAG: threonylcarbamoyl-AMP synthase [Candidatus Dadabacteria bacterium]|nr:threonylcarbamoyl-AMP synthase [Candidatus Dadabacteria bacterium]NIQ16278.1 threonylcarbamoyl-AMP synthase [Candidatus Dadabacteria bacterium]